MHDMPYKGGYSTGHYGRPGKTVDSGIHVVQVEIARRLYMNELRLAKEPEGFSKVQRFARETLHFAEPLGLLRQAQLIHVEPPSNFNLHHVNATIDCFPGTAVMPG